MAYLLDTGVFIEAKRRFYGLDFVPGYWDWLEREARSGVVLSIERVADEIDAQRDDLSVWAATLPRGFFLRPDATFSAAYSKVNTWASTAGFRPLPKASSSMWQTRILSPRPSLAGTPSSDSKSRHRRPASERSKCPMRAPEWA
ncbi:MAG: DUF4411 family protein [Planctomycetota bacterium]|nr:DUF4411 family protein [Planctomycetota bacterium]